MQVQVFKISISASGNLNAVRKAVQLRDLRYGIHDYILAKVRAHYRESSDGTCCSNSISFIWLS
jgi:hypothetical protein